MPFFYILDNFWFLYCIIPLFLIFIVFNVEYHHASGFATLVLFFSLMGLQLFTDVAPFTFILANPFKSLYVFLGYFALGTGYVVLKWYSFVHYAVRKYNEWQSVSNDRTMADYSRIHGIRLPLQVSDYKMMIVSWLVYWPLSAVWTLLNDPIRRLVNEIYNKIAGTLQSISDTAFRDVK